jgi:hypothetical protein
MVKLVDTPDLKSVVRKDVPVRLRLGAPYSILMPSQAYSKDPAGAGHAGFFVLRHPQLFSRLLRIFSTFISTF